MSKNYNVEHGFDMEEAAIKKRIDAWNKAQKYNEKITKELDSNSQKYFANEKAFHKWQNTKSNNDDIKSINKAREKMLAGMTLFLDGLADLKETSGTWIADPDYLNLIFISAFSKSTFYEKTLHWAKAEESFQKDRKTDLPGGYAGNGQEKIVREYDTQWFSLQFLYRQLEFTRFVPNYDILAGIWALNNSFCNNTSLLLDQWFYINKTQIQAKADLTDFTKGYFFRYNSHMTSEAQAQVLYILNNLFRYSMSKPMGTLEYPPWFCDSTITGNSDGDLPHSKNIIPHKINLVDIQRLNTAPIVTEDIAGMKAVPDEPEGDTVNKEQDDKKIASVVVKSDKSSTTKKGVKDRQDKIERLVEEKEVSRHDKGYKGKWDGERKLEFEEGVVTVSDGIVVKIRDNTGQKVERLLLADGTKYKLDRPVPE
uniref:Uncharacterized protein n=1 Tax=viral metagenome TaxID=1070528 RepID=A0A6C0JVU0_9ZZZZ